MLFPLLYIRAVTILSSKHEAAARSSFSLTALLRGTDALGASSITIAVQLLRFAVNLGASMALARLLRPDDFGVFSMAMTAVGLLLLFRDGGVESAMLHRDRIEPRELAALATLNALYGLMLAAVCAILGPLLAWLYHEPRLAPATLLLCVCFIGYGLSVQPAALLLRAHRFRGFAWVDFSALVAGLVTALYLAALGAGYWALFGMEVAVCLATLAGHWGAAGWRPRFNAQLGSVAGFARFGRDMSIIRALGHIAGNIDNILVGLAFGPATLAFYARAFRLMNMPQEGVNWPLTRVAVPTLSRLRADPVAFVAAFRRFNLISVAVAMPWAVFFLVAADEVVAVVYGAQWTASAPLLQMLGALGILNTFALAAAWVYVATGTVRRQIRWELVNVVILAAVFTASLRWGVAGVAIAASLVGAAIRIPALAYCFVGTPVRLRDLGAVLWRPALASTVAGATAVAVKNLSHAEIPILLLLAMLAAAMAAGYAVGWLLVPGWKQFLHRELRDSPPQRQ